MNREKHFHRKSNLFLICFLFALPLLAHAQLIPVLGSQRAGTAMAQFLKIGVGGRAVGMGEAFVAVANDASALYWNPAGLAQMTSSELIFSHVNWPVDVRHEFLGYVHRFGANALGVSVTALHTDDLEETTEFQPLGTGNYVPFGDIAVGVSFARQMTDRFSFGVTLKYMDETLAELHARNVFVDFGTYYRTGFGSSRFAVAVTNFGTNVAPSGTVTYRDGTTTDRFQDFSPPTIFRVGFATEVIDNEAHKMTAALQLNHPNDNAENVSAGAEYWWHKTLALRSGYRLNADEQSFTFGAGVAVPLARFHLNLDFAYSDFGRLGSATRAAAHFKF
ncbi:PorV/PorQ family protein [candidate division KSB1 bacterium]|nr:PorV/PorQ family protein [candidate division KSB1 bacterium]